MTTEEIQQRLQDIRIEIYLLDRIKDSDDNVNIHIVEKHINELQQEKYNLHDLLESYFDNMIGI